MIKLFALIVFLWSPPIMAIASYSDVRLKRESLDERISIGGKNEIIVRLYTSKSSKSKNIQLTCVVLLNQGAVEKDDKARRLQYYRYQVFPKFCEILSKDGNKYSIGFRVDSRSYRNFTEFTFIPEVYENCKLVMYFDDLRDEDGNRIRLVIDTKEFNWLDFRKSEGVSKRRRE